MKKERCGFENEDCCGNATWVTSRICNPGLTCTPIIPSPYGPGMCMKPLSNQVSKGKFLTLFHAGIKLHEVSRNYSTYKFDIIFQFSKEAYLIS